jgi:hypothetical protein
MIHNRDITYTCLASQSWRLESVEPTPDNPLGLIYTDGEVRVWLDRCGIFRSNYPSDRIDDMAQMQRAWFGLMVERGRQARECEPH